MLEKQKSHAFKKDVYLLGKDSDGVLYWLESPSWDCGWYWGFGYIETFTINNNPSRSRDINSHQHFDGFVWMKDSKNEYIYHINESPDFVETVLTESESWELSDLMKRFYTLKDAAEIYHTGSGHLSSGKLDSKNPEGEKYINEIALPAIFARIIEILTPVN